MKKQKTIFFSKLKIKKNIIIILLLIYYYIIKILKKNYKISNENYLKSNNEDSICLCTFGKEENKYVREFIDYYIKFGVDRFIIYDNNDIDGESFDMILSDFIKNNTVKIINCRGQKKIQIRKMNDCYLKNFKKFNWLIFYDIDEFIYLKNYSKIINFLNEEKFSKCQIITLTSIFHSDNDHIYYENKPVLERFPNFNKNITDYSCKSILRGNVSGIKIEHPHYLITKKNNKKNIISCDAFGRKMKNISQRIDIENYYINHYSFKSTEEFATKLARGTVSRGHSRKKQISKICNYFTHNLITLEKIILIENKIGFKLNFIRKKLKVYKK